MLFWSFLQLKTKGIGPGILLSLLRCLVILPFIGLWISKTIQFEGEPKRTDEIVHSLHVFVDDSDSMPKPLILDYKQKLEAIASEKKLNIQYTHLSDLNPNTSFSSLKNTIPQWISTLENEHWLLLTDGADQYPRTSATRSNTYSLNQQPSTFHGMVLVDSRPGLNLSIESLDMPPYLFKDRPTEITLSLRRSGGVKQSISSQIQLFAGNRLLRTMPVMWQSGEDAIEITMALPPLQKGHLALSARIPVLQGETASWDNEIFIPTEVLANTIGVLHLLGEPTWGGRFLRRWIKSEPKFDIISFFILRDPFDTDDVPIEELSLIPFPIDQLFNEELASFRLITMQNFSLSQFLQVKYQKNLMAYVNSGGSLLYLGGPRAFNKSEWNNKKIAQVMPLTSQNTSNLTYDTDHMFHIDISKNALKSPTLGLLARNLQSLLKSRPGFSKMIFQGLHHVDPSSLKKEQGTVLLEAVDVSNPTRREPLLVASFPSEGRAIWSFSDNLWSMALNEVDGTHRNLYNEFVEILTHWLLRESWTSSVNIDSIKLLQTQEGKHNWDIELKGVGIEGLAETKGALDWSINLCGKTILPKNIKQNFNQNTILTLTGEFSKSNDNSDSCTIDFSLRHPSIGSLKLTGVYPIIRAIPDQETRAHLGWVESLAKQTQATVYKVDSNGTAIKNDEINFVEWLRLRIPSFELLNINSDTMSDARPPTTKLKRQDPYWLLNSFWIWLSALAFAIEVILRRTIFI